MILLNFLQDSLSIFTDSQLITNYAPLHEL